MKDFEISALPEERVSFSKDLPSVSAGAMVGALCMLVMFYALYSLEETFHKDLNCIEE